MKRVGFDEQDFNIAAIFPSDHTIGYRNRCQVKTDGAILGFVSENSYQIAPIQDCIVLNDDCRTVLK
ncbi:MAG TPA: RNA methyltransferase, partial [Nitrosomonas sp.]|nr:RNA methyltransferase [Nitrosomonas sp.]